MFDQLRGARVHVVYFHRPITHILTASQRLSSERGAMSDKIPGSLHVANEVLSDLVGYAAMECYGVVGMTAPNAADGIAKILPASRLRRGVVVTPTDEGLQVELYVVIEYGTNISTVSQNLVDQVTFALEEYARVPIASIDVHVEDVKVRM